METLSSRGHFKLYQFPHPLELICPWISLGGLPKSKGLDTILVVVDRLTKYSHFIASSHPYTAKEVMQSQSIKGFLHYKHKETRNNFSIPYPKLITEGN